MFLIFKECVHRCLQIVAVLLDRLINKEYFFVKFAKWDFILRTANAMLLLTFTLTAFKAFIVTTILHAKNANKAII